MERTLDSNVSTPIPIACSLSPAELEARQSNVLHKMSRAVVETKETATGYAFRFPPENELLTELVALIVLERACCPFITFQLTAEAGNGPLWLELIVPDEAKPLIVGFFNVQTP